MGTLYDLVHKEGSANNVRAQWVKEQFRKHTKGKKSVIRVLDIASGDGTFSKIFVIAGRIVQVDAVDLNPKYRKETRSNGIDYFQCDIFEYDKRKDRFKYDVIFCGEFCEHLPAGKPEELMKLIQKWLKKSGVLILTVPNFLIKSGGHLRVYDEKSMLELVKDFKVIETAGLPEERVLFHCCVCGKG